MVTVGGGYAGFVTTFLSLFDNQGEGVLVLLLRTIFLALCAYITVSGLVFVHDPRLVRPLAVALVLQIPWISSPLAFYYFAAGPAVIIGIGSPKKTVDLFSIEWKFFLGGSWRFSMLQGDRWAIGVNLFALALLILLWKSVQARTSEASPARPTVAPSESAN